MRANRTVLITGAGRGYGAALQTAFASEGWTTLPLVRKVEHFAHLKERWGDTCFPILADLSSDMAIAEIQKSLEENVQSLNVLINNAGFGGEASRLADVTTDEVLDLFEVHCLGALRATKAAAPWLRKTEQSFVVNVSSRLASLTKNASGEFSGRGFSYSYRIAKAAQNMLTLCLADEFANSNVSVFAVHPGRLHTASGSSDADVTPAEAAARLFHWLGTAERGESGGFLEPGVGDLAW